ncbi:ferritin light chain, oocyte isoform-like [Neoarius graeffei]|uniref:ferritin light chain, oocyte isoform-like n=1 Tax=Neoarius graeffei TaxID=443677 RepID=UPI00298C8019|nr:ferritin light chain, oocyte isoform-like [Neoarius graeffei]
MSEPSGKRLKMNVPKCKAHRALQSTKAKQNFPAVVEEGLCGVSTSIMRFSYRLQALAKIFEQDDLPLSRLAAFFHQESMREQAQAEAMLQYLSERGGHYCNKVIQRPCTEQVCALLPALEFMLGQWKEEMAILVELCQLAREHEDPHTNSMVKSHFLNPLVPKIKLLGDLLTNARRVGCTTDSTGRFGEYLIDQLYKELNSA